MKKQNPFKKILIANRGEIAVRVIRACKMMGIKSVAVYSEIDKNAMHVREADQSVLIGPANPAESYLSIEKIIDAARQTGAEAIHPGYGFLSENATFAEEVEKNELTFIGPSSEAIKLMGDKATARSLMLQAGVPIVPGFQPTDFQNADWELVAKKIGFPLLVKAIAGGGGKGMRVVSSSAELLAEISSAQREAQNAFGDDRIYLEKLITDAHHIEFQILADQHGNIVQLGERECSIQRRHQKIIEETPSPLLDETLRKEMGLVAVEAARKVGYTSAGTVEFIVDAKTKKFYFLEMNTRLQVEHPITEMVNGIDLVNWQIKIAAGEKLSFSQSEIVPRGHAIEARIYAEDAENHFLPSIGEVLEFSVPIAPNIRLDSGIETGDHVSIHYDPMLAKVSVFAQERSEAISNLIQVLQSSVILGLTTNLEFLADVLLSKKFQNGIATTSFVEEFFDEWKSKLDSIEDRDMMLIAASLLDYVVIPRESLGSEGESNAISSPWDRLGNFRLGERQS